MQTKFLSLVLSALILFLNACSPFTMTSSAGEQPTPEVEILPVTGYQPVVVGQVEAEVGVGSPIPVQVTVTGSLPDTCAQIELVQQQQVGSSFHITLSSIPSNAEGCVQDPPPFRIVIPLNITNAPAGLYSVDVNGLGADFELNTGNTTSSLPTVDTAITKEEVQVAGVNIETGIGSPIPVHAVIGLNLPNTCAQLGEMRLHREGTTFHVRLIADIAERPDCIPNSIPFRAEIPLNMINLPEGPYEVNVNGVTASFDPRLRPAENSSLMSCSELTDVPIVNGQVNYNDISFIVDPTLAAAVEAQSCQAVALAENQAPGEAHPPYTAFFFPGYQREHTDLQPEVRVYEVTGDMQSYTYPLNMLADLQSVLDQHPEPVTWFAAAPLHEHAGYVEFANGTGVRGLLEYMQDFFFFTNNGLIYEFNGLTQDGRYFVSVRYPVSVPFLMELDGPQLPPINLNPQAIIIPEWPSEFEGQTRVIEDYNAEALRRFEQISEAEVSPSLTVLDALVQSIQVSKP